MAISIPGPRQVSLSSDVDGGSQDQPARRPFPRMQQPAVRHISRPSRPAAPTAMVSHRVRRPTPPCHMTQPRCCTAQSMKPIFLESVHLGPVLRSAPLSLSTQGRWSRMLLFANHHLTLSVGICWNSGTELEPAHGEESRTRRATKIETREPAGLPKNRFAALSTKVQTRNSWFSAADWC